jgi:hypothetical protein
VRRNERRHIHSAVEDNNNSRKILMHARKELSVPQFINGKESLPLPLLVLLQGN